jgi:hypothetical protein
MHIAGLELMPASLDHIHSGTPMGANLNPDGATLTRRIVMRFLGILAALSLFVIFPTPLLASELDGQVLEGNGRPASNVPVHLIGPQPTTQEQEERTNESGFYKFKELEPGKYTVTIAGRSTEVHVFGRKTRRDMRLP